MLFSRFGINYNDLPQQFRKGSVLVRAAPDMPLADPMEEKNHVERDKANEDDQVKTGRRRNRKAYKEYEGLTGELNVVHEDIIRDPFWEDRPWLLL